MLAEIFIVRLEADARLQQETASLVAARSSICDATFGPMDGEA